MPCACTWQQSLLSTLSCIYFLLFFACGSYACFFCFVSSFFLAVLPLGHLPPLSPRRSFCFVRTQWPSGSGIRDHPLLHGLLKNPSLSAAWYVLFFLLKAAFEMLLAWGTSVFAASQTCPFLVEYEHVPVALGSVVIVRKVAGKELPHQLPGKHSGSKAKNQEFCFTLGIFFPYAAHLAIQFRMSHPKSISVWMLDHCIPVCKKGGGAWMLEQAKGNQLILSAHP